MNITEKAIAGFEQYLIRREREKATVKQYVRAVQRLGAWLCGREADKELLMQYKDELKAKYAPSSVNSAIAAINGFAVYMERYDLKLNFVKKQKNIFADPERELSRKEYDALIAAAERTHQTRLMYMLQTIFATGIRVSELKYITVESLETGIAEISCKGKNRRVFLSNKLRHKLTKYAKKNGIASGCIFITRNGNPVDRSNIAKGMKRLAEIARVMKKKVFPHNLRHLFARIYYSAHKDIARLADILGHSSINTTRIYTMESGAVHRRQIEQLRLV